MIARILFRLIAVVMVIILMGLTGCERDLGTLDPAKNPTDAEIFTDGFGPDIQYAAFGGSKVDAFDVDYKVKYKGTEAMKIAIPDADNPQGAYAGGAFFTSIGRDLSGYDALTFWAKASKGATINVVGFGNDLSGTSRFVTQRSNLKVNTNWQKYIIPIPLASKLVAERGMFYYSEGPEDNVGYTLWFDEVQFEKLGTIAHPRPAILNEQDQVFPAKVGDRLPLGGTYVIFNLDEGVDEMVETPPAYFTFESSDNTVATVDEDGVVTALAIGSATITAKLGDVDAKGSFTVNIAEAPPQPEIAAPAPTVEAENVISLFSDAYTNVTIDTWSADWDVADVNDIQVAGDNVKFYSNLSYAGVEFTSQQIDASTMTHMHFDLWTPDESAGATFGVKLVDFGGDGVFGGGDDSEHELVFDENSSPALQANNWVSFDVPLTNFTGLTGKSNLAQLIISGNTNLNNVYLDNIYLYGSGPASNEPTEPAPAPTVAANDVISLFSNVYTDEAVDTWSAEWDQADVSDVQIAGDDVKLYENMVYAGIEFTSQPINASAMTHFHMDIWTPDATAAPTVFRIKLVDFGADGAFGGGDDVEHEITLDDASTPAIASNAWVGLDIPLSDFTGLTTTEHIAQMIISGDLSTLYVDNIYFYGGGGGTSTEPTTAAPTPTLPAGDVISLFSGPYTDVAVDTWSAEWDQADLSDVQVAGDDVKLYTNLVYAGIEFTSQTIDAAEMTHFHMQIWTPDPVDIPTAFKIKLVDFGADGVWSGGGDDVEHELVFDAASSPALVTGNWLTFDIPLTDFVNLTTKEHLSQLIISGDINTVYVDNILLHK